MKVKRALNKFFSSGFTLVELLIVIAILGILAAGIVVVINPMEKINSANMAKAETFAAGIRNSLAMNLVGEWTFDDGTAKDTSGYGNDGDVNGATSATDRNGQANKAFSFDGVDDYVKITQNTSNFASSFTIEAWVYSNQTSCPAGESYACAIWSDEYDTGAGTNEMGVANDGLWCYFNIGGNWKSVVGGTIPFGQWSHVACVYSGTNLSVWVNGVNVNSTSANGSLASSAYYKIGRTDGGYNKTWNGKIDDVRIYSKGLLSYQIQQLYAQGLVKHLLALK